MNRRYVLSIYILVAVCLVLAFATGFMVSDLVRYRTGDFPLFLEAYNLIQTHGYNELPEDPAVEYGMIRGLIEAYGDPFTSFVEPARHELESNNLHGSFGGIGVRMVREEDGTLLLYPFPDGPAAEAGAVTNTATAIIAQVKHAVFRICEYVFIVVLLLGYQPDGCWLRYLFDFLPRDAPVADLGKARIDRGQRDRRRCGLPR